MKNKNHKAKQKRQTIGKWLWKTLFMSMTLRSSSILLQLLKLPLFSLPVSRNPKAQAIQNQMSRQSLQETLVKQQHKMRMMLHQPRIRLIQRKTTISSWQSSKDTAMRTLPQFAMFHTVVAQSQRRSTKMSKTMLHRRAHFQLLQIQQCLPLISSRRVVKPPTKNTMQEVNSSSQANC